MNFNLMIASSYNNLLWTALGLFSWWTIVTVIWFGWVSERPCRLCPECGPYNLDLRKLRDCPSPLWNGCLYLAYSVLSHAYKTRCSLFISAFCDRECLQVNPLMHLTSFMVWFDTEFNVCSGIIIHLFFNTHELPWVLGKCNSSHYIFLQCSIQRSPRLATIQG